MALNLLNNCSVGSSVPDRGRPAPLCATLHWASVADPLIHRVGPSDLTDPAHLVSGGFHQTLRRERR